MSFTAYILLWLNVLTTCEGKHCHDTHNDQLLVIDFVKTISNSVLLDR